MNELGQKIKQLRREKKLTQEALAGERLTKGMLSLIENGKAQPSMESLHYIADRLEVEVSQLLKDNSSQEIRLVLDEIEQLFSSGKKGDTEKLQQLINIVEPILPKLTGNTYENARIFDLYGRAAYYVKLDTSDTFIQQAIAIYQEIHAYNQMVRCKIHLSTRDFTAYNYKDSLEKLIEIDQEIIEKNYPIDELVSLDLAYMLTVVYLAVGDADHSTVQMEKALDLSRQEKIFYRIDDLYRLMISLKMLEGDGEQARYYLKKLKQYVALAEDDFITTLSGFVEVNFMNMYEKTYEKALLFIDQMLEGMKEEEPRYIFKDLYESEKSYSLFMLGRYEEALHHLEKLVVPTYLHHPYDLSHIYMMYAIRGICREKLGQIDQAITDIQEAKRLVDPMPQTPYKTFIENAYEGMMG